VGDQIPTQAGKHGSEGAMMCSKIGRHD
jgi:hypothetical protein